MCSRLVRRFAAFLVVLVPLLAFLQASPAADKDGAIPEFRIQEIEKGLGVGYAVLLVDVNNDGKKDIVVVDQKRVVWYENPSWKRRNIIEGQTKPDNVCITAADIDGDGQLDFALGAAWNPANTKSGGTLQW
ncbi:MAG: FG-GAP repeat domain-containing protein, partial [Gemmataceae bacterium]